jgi:hypothetical protein
MNCQRCDGRGREEKDGAGFSYEVTCRACRGTGLESDKLTMWDRTINGSVPVPDMTTRDQWERRKFSVDEARAAGWMYRRENPGFCVTEVKPMGLK